MKWYANDTLVAVLSGGAGDYSVTTDGVQIDGGTLGATLDTVKRLFAGFDEPPHKPTLTARPYKQFGIRGDVQDGSSWRS